MRESTKKKKEEYRKSEHGKKIAKSWREEHKEDLSTYNKALYREQHPTVHDEEIKKKQDKFYRYIRDYYISHNYPPTYEEIAEHTDYKSNNGINKTINALVNRGKIGIHNRRIYLIGYRLVSEKELMNNG